jgi:hypothetical protein
VGAVKALGKAYLYPGTFGALVLFGIAKVYEENEEALEKEILDARGVRPPKGIAPERRYPGF